MTDETTAKRSAREMDARSLRAVAHPLRMRILQLFWTEGPATATMLANRLGESTGTLSWHLRHLAEHGFIEEDAERGTKRERWWRAPATSLVQSRAVEFLDDPGLRGPLSVYIREVVDWHFRLVANFYREAGARQFSDEWISASTATSWTGADTRMSPRQLRALNEELRQVTRRHVDAAKAAPEPDNEQVIVLWHLFPYRPPDSA
jgi:DNA-binding transcriptional ArsR family regulator